MRYTEHNGVVTVEKDLDVHTLCVLYRIAHRERIGSDPSKSAILRKEIDGSFSIQSRDYPTFTRPDYTTFMKGLSLDQALFLLRSYQISDFTFGELDPYVNHKPTVRVQVKRPGVHVRHCCKDHGCKYGDFDCPVASGPLEQDYLCESCHEEKDSSSCWS